MDTQTIDSIRTIFHYGSFALLGLGLGLGILGFLRPKAFSKVFHEFSQRRFIILTGAFVCLLAGTIFTVTYPGPDTTFQSNAPRPATHGTNDLENIDENIVPQNTASAAEPKATEPKAAAPTKPRSATAPNNPQQSEQKTSNDPNPGRTESMSRNSSSQPQQIQPKDTTRQQSNKNKDCKIELFFICL